MVRFFVTADANAETRVGEATDFSPVAKFWFNDKEYGSGLDGVCVVVTCRDPDLQLKQRVRLNVEKVNPKPFVPFPRKPGGKYLDMDLMLNYDEIVKRRHREQFSGMVSAALHHRTDKEREHFIRERIVQEVPAVLRKYVSRKKNPLKDFDVDAFERDLRKCLLEGGLEEVTPQYEAEVKKMQDRWKRHKELTGRDILLPGEELPQ